MDEDPLAEALFVIDEPERQRLLAQIALQREALEAMRASLNELTRRVAEMAVRFRIN